MSALICTNDLFTCLETFENYSGVDDDADVARALLGYRDQGYIKEFDTYHDLQAYVGARPVLSKLGCVKKTKFNPDTATYITKNRIILDCKQSQVSKAAARTHKSVLPRVSDAVQSALGMLADLQPDETLTLLVVDIIDAFWLIPLRHEERRYFCAKFSGKYYVFLRAQGSRGAPLTFAAIIGLAARLVQSLVSGPQHWRTAHQEARMQVYVDDPLAMIRGTEERVQRIATLIFRGMDPAWFSFGLP